MLVGRALEVEFVLVLLEMVLLTEAEALIGPTVVALALAVMVELTPELIPELDLV